MFGTLHCAKSQTDHVTVTDAQDVTDLRAQLEEERRKKRELAAANVKLSGKLKVGQDAIRAEQQLNRNLQDQLNSLSTRGSQVLTRVEENPSSVKTIRWQGAVHATFVLAKNRTSVLERQLGLGKGRGEDKRFHVEIGNTC